MCIRDSKMASPDSFRKDFTHLPILLFQRNEGMAKVPKSALDFLKPEFKGKIITTYPHVDDITLYLYQILVDKYGPEFLEKLKANEPVFVRGHLGVSRAIAAGDE